MAYDTSDTESTERETQQAKDTVPSTVAIEDDLPLMAIDIENEKDIMANRGHASRRFSKWFAARPIPAVRLAILGSVYPERQITDDELLKLMQIGPSEIDSNIAQYVRQKYTEEKDRYDTLDDHYNYPNPNSQTPSKSQIKQNKQHVKEYWGGELPTILDPTAGRGTIPFEAMRYGLPAISNELDPVPFTISKITLELAPEVGSVAESYDRWTKEIIERTKDRISQYYPTKESGRQILNYAMTYIIDCDSCMGRLPLINNWRLNDDAAGGDVITPTYQDGNVSYNHARREETPEFDPSDAPVARGGDAECPHCGVTTDAARIREKFQNNEFEYSVFGVSYESKTGEYEYRAGDKTDLRGLEKARKRADSFELMGFFAETISEGKETERLPKWGMEQWRDVFTPRQLVAHYELFDVINNIKAEIREAHESDEAELIITLITQAVNQQVLFNNRLAKWFPQHGTGHETFANQSYSIKRMFVGNNIVAQRKGLKRRFKHVIDNYEDLASQVPQVDSDIGIYNTDATSLSKKVDTSSAEVAVVDPPYFDSVMYGEMSDFMMVSHKEVLDNVFPDAMQNISNDEQMVVNNVRHDNPEEFYESMMRDMFAELGEILVENGILTLMFTDRETKAWNTILKTLIQSDFTITAAHPIKTEASDKAGMHDKARVESSIFVTARNTPNETDTSEWREIRDTIESIARKEAQRLLSVETISKIDTSIEAFGAALEAYSDAYPVEDKYGDTVYPGQVLTTVRNEVYSVIANDELSTKTDQLDGVSRWYILANVLYDDADIPFDEANQLGIGADIDINEIKRPTKIWSKSGGNVSLNNHSDRVQDIVKLRDNSADNPSTRKYPVNPTADSFTYTIDAVHAALHIYKQEGQRATRDWLAQREFKSNQQFKKAIKALLEAVPVDSQTREILQDLIAGETGDYLDISVEELSIGNSSSARQSGIEEYK